MPTEPAESDPVEIAPDNVLHVDFEHSNDTITVSGASTAEVLEALETAGVEAQAHGPRTPDWATYDLSEREVDIVRAIAAGHQNDAVADQLYLSINTVKSYIRSAYRKIGVDSRTQAVLWAVEHGLVHPGDECAPQE